jgi:hemerythrin
MLDKNEYPSLASHRAAHKVLTDKVLALKRVFDADMTAITPELLHFCGTG